MKADTLEWVEGSKPECARASIQVSTGVLDHCMCSKGQLGNWGDPEVSCKQPETDNRPAEDRGKPRASGSASVRGP